MTDVKHLSNAAYNLFSITKRLQNGWKLKGDADSITIAKVVSELKFNICIPTPERAIYAVCLQQDEQEVGATNVENQQEVTELKAHVLLRCMEKELTRKTAQSLGWKIAKFNNIPCEHCAVGKARQKNLVQQSTSVKAV